MSLFWQNEFCGVSQFSKISVYLLYLQYNGYIPNQRLNTKLCKNNSLVISHLASLAKPASKWRNVFIRATRSRMRDVFAYKVSFSGKYSVHEQQVKAKANTLLHSTSLERLYLQMDLDSSLDQCRQVGIGLLVRLSLYYEFSRLLKSNKI